MNDALYKKETNQLLIENLKIANSFMARLKGLMFRKKIEETEGLLLTRTKQIHTFWMSFAIDVVYLKKIKINEYEIVFLQENMKPCKIGKITPFSTDVLELKDGMIKKLALKSGDRLIVKGYIMNE